MFCQANICSCVIVVLVVRSLRYAHLTHSARAKFKVTARSCWAKTTTTTDNKITKAYQRWSRIFNGFQQAFRYSYWTNSNCSFVCKIFAFHTDLKVLEGNLEIKKCAYRKKGDIYDRIIFMKGEYFVIIIFIIFVIINFIYILSLRNKVAIQQQILKWFKL